MRNSQAKKTDILQSSVKLMAADGYEATTFKRIANSSKAAIGSVAHFFDDKPRLADAALADITGRFAAALDRALQGEGKDIKGSVTDAIQTVFDWVQEHPDDHLVSLELGGRRLGGRTLQPMLASSAVLSVVVAWAKPLIASAQIAVIDERTIAAVMLGGAWAIAAVRAQVGGTDQMIEPALLARVTTGALAALEPQALVEQGNSPAPKSPKAKADDRQPTLF